KGRENDACYRSELEYVVINVDKADVLRIAEAEDWMILPAVLDGSDLFKLENRAAVRLTTRMKELAQAMHNGSFQALELEAERWFADEIVTEFLRPLTGTISNEIVWEGPPCNLPRLVHCAEDFLEADPGHRPNIQQLASGLHVSPRQLFRAFHAEIGMSPAKYLKHYRMAQARLALLAAGPAETTVTDVAFLWGFLELGRFAVEYRQEFGECPSQTLRRMRRSGAINEAGLSMARMGL
ncbi:MAG: helix-turn-helix transcriptional regulator, partial [Gammaproteobacteria bacterium]|nr:helix-turn-helix transcriptional regulator [Gammaproteobacteria bacterium]